eukprot:3161457-Amphidinium_carterae.2
MRMVVGDRWSLPTRQISRRCQGTFCTCQTAALLAISWSHFDQDHSWQSHDLLITEHPRSRGRIDVVNAAAEALGLSNSKGVQLDLA